MRHDPEYKHAKGVEITTGPLGQGLASSVGFAYSQRRQRGLFDADAPVGASPFDHTIWVIASDGDLQEGVTAEASSLAGRQELGNLVVIYDENHISIEDDTDISFTEDVLATPVTLPSGSTITPPGGGFSFSPTNGPAGGPGRCRPPA